MNQYEEIYIEGFGSISKPFTYKFGSKPGLTVITGRNGIGKTTVFLALDWVLHGKTQIKKKIGSVETWEDKRPKGYQGTRVVLTIQGKKHRYEIARHLNYKGKIDGKKAGNDLIIKRDGKEKTFTDKNAANEYIRTNITGCSQSAFLHAILFGQKMKRFIEEEGPAKKKVFEELFETQWISNAAEIADKERSRILTEQRQAASSIEVTRGKMSFVKQSYAQVKGQIKTAKEKIENQRAITRKAKETLLSEIEELQEDLKGYNPKEIEKQIEDQVKAQQEWDNKGKEKLRTEFQILQIEGSIKTHTEQLKSLRLQIHKLKSLKCFECGAPIKKSDSIQRLIELKNQKRAAEGMLKLAEKPLPSLKTKYAELEKDLSKKPPLSLNDLTRRRSFYQGLVQKYRAKKQSLKALRESKPPDLEEFLKLKSDLKLKLKGLKGELKIQKKALRQLDLEIFNYDWLKTTLGNGGLKAYIFSEACNKTNQALEKYCKPLGMKVELGVSTDSYHKDFYAHLTQGGIARNYDNLSGGEQQMVSVFIAFAINDVLSAGVKRSNILLLDEVFESLDEINQEIVMDFIIEKSRKLSIHMITHNSSVCPSDTRFVDLGR